MDEPYSGLTVALRRALRREVRAMQQEIKQQVIAWLEQREARQQRMAVESREREATREANREAIEKQVDRAFDAVSKHRIAPQDKPEPGVPWLTV